MQPFAPTDDQRAKLLADCASPDTSLAELAEQYHTSVEALSLYITSDAALASLRTAHTAAIIRARVAAAAQLTRAVDALAWIIESYNAAAPKEFLPRSPRAAAIQEHHRTAARRAAALLLRIANLNPAPLSIPSTPTPAPSHTAPHAHDESASRGLNQPNRPQSNPPTPAFKPTPTLRRTHLQASPRVPQRYGPSG